MVSPESPMLTTGAKQRKIKREWFLYGIIGALAAMVIVLSVVGFIQRQTNTEQEARIRAIEKGTTIAEIATCYASARGRPAIVTILRGIAAKLDPNPRAATAEFIDRYEASAPTLPQCDAKAKAAGFTRKDFPAVSRTETSVGKKHGNR